MVSSEYHKGHLAIPLSYPLRVYTQEPFTRLLKSVFGQVSLDRITFQCGDSLFRHFVVHLIVLSLPCQLLVWLEDNVVLIVSAYSNKRCPILGEYPAGFAVPIRSLLLRWLVASCGTSYRVYCMLSTILFRFVCRGALKSPRRHRATGWRYVLHLTTFYCMLSMLVFRMTYQAVYLSGWPRYLREWLLGRCPVDEMNSNR